MTRSGPHHRTIGNAQSRQMPTEVRRGSGHWSTGPRSVCDQSSARMRSAISLPPGKTGSSVIPFQMLYVTRTAPHGIRAVRRRLARYENYTPVRLRRLAVRLVRGNANRPEIAVGVFD